MFDGATYNDTLDRHRLSGQWLGVWQIMRRGEWLTLAEVSAFTGYPEASISARLRDFRKERFGGHHVSRRRRSLGSGDGLFEYRLQPAITGESFCLPFEAA